MEIKKSDLKDLDKILIVYQKARDYMKKTNNPTQWGDTRPEAYKIIEDINKGIHFSICDNDSIIACFTFYIGIDPFYNYIEGSWLDDKEYGVIHKVASDQSHKGIMKLIFDYCFKQIKNIRIDTHKDNSTMIHCIKSNGFTYCGIVYVDDNTPRRAYQKEII